MLKTLKIDDSVCFSHLPQLQRYTGAIDESQRPILLSCLRTAIIEVQDRSGKSIAPCEMRLEISCNGSAFVPLYGNVSGVSAVMTPEGADVDYTLCDGGIDTGNAVYERLVIDYTTSTDEGESMRLLPVVFQYAAALFDGQPEMLPKIIAQC